MYRIFFARQMEIIIETRLQMSVFENPIRWRTRWLSVRATMQSHLKKLGSRSFLLFSFQGQMSSYSSLFQEYNFELEIEAI